jgi:hypothetical protein
MNICSICQKLLWKCVICCDGHKYHSECIQSWLLNNNTSPITREEMNNIIIEDKTVFSRNIELVNDTNLLDDYIKNDLDDEEIIKYKLVENITCDKFYKLICENENINLDKIINFEKCKDLYEKKIINEDKYNKYFSDIINSKSKYELETIIENNNLDLTKEIYENIVKKYVYYEEIDNDMIVCGMYFHEQSETICYGDDDVDKIIQNFKNVKFCLYEFNDYEKFKEIFNNIKKILKKEHISLLSYNIIQYITNEDNYRNTAHETRDLCPTSIDKYHEFLFNYIKDNLELINEKNLRDIYDLDSYSGDSIFKYLVNKNENITQEIIRIKLEDVRYRSYDEHLLEDYDINFSSYLKYFKNRGELPNIIKYKIYKYYEQNINNIQLQELIKFKFEVLCLNKIEAIENFKEYSEKDSIDIEINFCDYALKNEMFNLYDKLKHIYSL